MINHSLPLLKSLKLVETDNKDKDKDKDNISK